MPQFPNDALVERMCHGDIALQFCANTQPTNIHALRDIVKNTSDFMVLRWRQEGSVPVIAPGPNGKPESARNFMGFHDGSANPNSNDAALMDRIVWVGDDHDEPGWARHGTYQAVRIIRMFVESWDRTPLGEQQRIFGREKMSGAPLGKPQWNRARRPRLRLRSEGRPDAAQRPYPARQSPAHGDRGEHHPAASVQLLERRLEVRPHRGRTSFHRLPGGHREGLRRRPEPAERRAARGIHQAVWRRLFLRPARRSRRGRLSRARAHRGDHLRPEDRVRSAPISQERMHAMSLRTRLKMGVLLAALAAPFAAHASAADAPLDLVQPIADYKVFVSQKTDKLVADTTKFVAAIKAGDLQKARDLYAPTRMSYEAVEPVAELFNDLDGSIDSRADDHEKKEEDPGFTGFHRLEYGLWMKNSTQGLSETADKLLADVKELHGRIAKLTFPPEKVVSGAGALMDEMAKTKISGEEDRYSHTDLWDFKANFDGSQKIFLLVSPLVAKKDPEFAKKVTENFKVVDRRSPSTRRSTAMSFTTSSASRTARRSRPRSTRSRRIFRPSKASSVWIETSRAVAAGRGIARVPRPFHSIRTRNRLADPGVREGMRSSRRSNLSDRHILRPEPSLLLSS